MLADAEREAGMTLADWLWVAVAAYGLHILEEFALDWRNWARSVIGLPVEWPHFYVVNALVIVLGVACAEVAARAPLLGLIFPALMLINGTFFHVAPMLKTGGRFSPGVATGVALFYPIGIACYWRAARDGNLDLLALLGSLAIGAVLMAFPIVLLKIKDRPYFRQDR
jgi:hypothetical protein